jgi:hypothetical protein
MMAGRMAKGALTPTGTVSPTALMLALFLSFTCAPSFMYVTSFILQQERQSGNFKLWRWNDPLDVQCLGGGDQCDAAAGRGVAEAPSDVVRPCMETGTEREVPDVLTDAGRYHSYHIVAWV